MHYLFSIRMELLILQCPVIAEPFLKLVNYATLRDTFSVNKIVTK
jgi:hypothetical protein